MATLWMEFGQDFQLTANGGLAMASGWDETRQAIERIALTNPASPGILPDCMWAPKFGLGLPRQVGQPINQALITAAISEATRRAPGVDTTSAPTIVVAENADHTFSCEVTVPLANGTRKTTTIQVS